MYIRIPHSYTNDCGDSGGGGGDDNSGNGT